MGLRVRIAPSPSGYLHLGLTRTFLFNWLWAKNQGGQVILRIEDTDQERSSIESVRAILEALRWLELDWDEGPEAGGAHGPYFQSERRHLYREAADKLIAEGKAYRCYCTKEDLDRARAAIKEKNPKAQFVYPGTCRERNDSPDQPYVVRFRAPLDGSTDFVDRVFGPISTPNREQQDFVILRSDGFPLYNLACVVDDHAMGINLVARGRDHIGNTPLQVLLYRALGYEVPEFAHLPMILNPKGEKLSKRHGAVGVQDFRERGYPPDAVLNYLVRFGWSFGDREIFSRNELIQLFSWDRVSRSDGRFDEKKFADVSFEHLKTPELTSTERYAKLAEPFLAQRGLEAAAGERLHAAIETIRPRARTLVDAADAVDYYFRDPPEFDEKAQGKFLKSESADHLAKMAAMLEDVDEWRSEPLEERFRNWITAEDIPMKSVAQPARVALTGRSASPPLFDVMVVLGKDRSVQRLKRGAELARSG